MKNKHVEMVLPEGGQATDKVRRVDGSAIFLIDAAGEKRIPRAGLKEITVIRNGKLWRTLFVVWGGLTVADGAVETGGKGIAVRVGICVGGYVLGDYLDRRKTVLTLIE